jgi:hypothetical protein
MGVITGGRVISTGTTTIPGSRPRIYFAEAVPTDTNIGYEGTPANGTLAANVLTGFVYERQAAVWVRIDTL